MMKENKNVILKLVLLLFLDRVLLPCFPQRIYPDFKIGIEFAKNMIHNMSQLQILRIRTNYLLYANQSFLEFSDDEKDVFNVVTNI